MIPYMYQRYVKRIGALNAIGPLPDCIRCEAYQELNGEWTLAIEYPTDGRNAERLKTGVIVKSLANSAVGVQHFEIVSIDRSDTISVTARHISYWLNSIICRPWLNGGLPVSAQEAWTRTTTSMLNSAIANSYSRVGPDATTDAGVHILVPTTLRDALLNVLIPAYGGIARASNLDLVWDMGTAPRSTMQITSGVNLVSAGASADTMGLESAVLPYYGSAGDDDKPIVMADQIISYGLELPVNVLPLDMTGEFEEIPTQQQLMAAATAYAQRRAAAIMEMSMSCTVVPTTEPVEPGDIITVNSLLDAVAGPHQVTAVRYDSLQERTIEIQIGPTDRSAQKIISAAIAAIKR